LDRATILSIHDNNKLFRPAEQKLYTNCPVELAERKGAPGEVWQIQRTTDGIEKPNKFNQVWQVQIITDDIEKPDVFNAYVACEADLNFVLAERSGMLVLQEKHNNEKSAVLPVWEAIGEVPGSKNVIDDSTFEVYLPDIMMIPEGFENPSRIPVGTDGTTNSIWLWKVPKDKIGIIYKNIFYTGIVDTSFSTQLTAIVKDDSIVSVKGAELMPSMTLNDWLNLDGRWTKDALLQVTTLASRGIISHVERMYLSSDLLSPDDVVTAAPAISVVNMMIMEGIHLNLSHWKELEQHMESLECLEFVGGTTIDKDSVFTFAMVCSKAGKVVFGDVSIEDIRGFIDNMVMCVNITEGNCTQMQFGKEMFEKYKKEISEMRDMLGWVYAENDETDCIKIEKDDKFEERQVEFAKKQWHRLNTDDRVSCLKLQFDRIESKLDNLTQLFKSNQQNQEETHEETNRRQRRECQMETQINKLEADRQRRQLERLTGRKH